VLDATVVVVDASLKLSTAGSVRVLFVSVSGPAIDAMSASLTAVLNWASVPDTVLFVRLIVLFWNVSPLVAVIPPPD
jgi:hypothetical protein